MWCNMIIIVVSYGISFQCGVFEKVSCPQVPCENRRTRFFPCICQRTLFFMLLWSSNSWHALYTGRSESVMSRRNYFVFGSVLGGAVVLCPPVLFWKCSFSLVFASLTLPLGCLQLLWCLPLSSLCVVSCSLVPVLYLFTLPGNHTWFLCTTFFF